MSMWIASSRGRLGTLALVACATSGCGAENGASDPQGDASGTSGAGLTSSDTISATDTPTGSTIPRTR